MKNNVFNSLLLVVVAVIMSSFTAATYTMEEEITSVEEYPSHEWYTTYKNIRITPETLWDLCPPASKSLKSALKEWKGKGLYPLFYSLARMICKNAHNQGVERLKDAGFTNLRPYNFIFALKGKGDDEFIIKISGLANRLAQLNSQAGREYGSPIPAQEIQQLINGEIKTHQTGSRMAHWLLATKWKSLNPTAPIELTEQYLVPINETSDLMDNEKACVDDNNCMIVEKRIKNGAPFTENPQLFFEAYKDLQSFVKHVMYWNPNDTQFLIVEKKKTGKKVITPIDYESPNNSKYKDFFYGDYSIAKANAHHGVHELMKLRAEVETHLPPSLH